MLSRFAVLVPALLAVQAGAAHWAGRGERVPSPPQFSRFPVALRDWRKFQDDPVTAETLAQLKADRTLGAIYARDGSPQGLQQPAQQSWMGSVFVAWFQSQRGGESQPHSPQVCLPATGWTPTVSDRIAMDTRSGTVTVNRYVANLGAERVVVLYWYQTGARVIASEWAAKFWVLADRLEQQRTDTSLVRIAVWNSGRDNVETTGQALDLAAATYPELAALFVR